MHTNTHTHIFRRKKGFFRLPSFLNWLVFVTFIFQNIIYTKGGEKAVPWERKKNPTFPNPKSNRFGGYCESLQYVRRLWGNFLPLTLQCLYRLSTSYALRNAGYPDLNNKGSSVRPPDEGSNCFYCLFVSWVNNAVQKEDPGWNSLLPSKDRSKKVGLMGGHRSSQYVLWAWSKRVWLVTMAQWIPWIDVWFCYLL